MSEDALRRRKTFMNVGDNPHSGRIRAERKKRGWDTARMAAELRKASDQPAKLPDPASLQRSIQRWENGRIKKISERYRLLYAAAFDIPDTELFPHQQQQAPAHQNAESIADDEDMERRRLLGSIVALGAVSSPALDALADIQGSVERALGADTTAHLDDWEQTLAEYRYTYLTVPTARLVPELAADLVVVRSLMTREKLGTPLRHSWCRIVAGLSMLLAKALSGQQKPREARMWWTTAQQAADTSGDVNLSLWISGEQLIHGLYEHRPVPLMLRRANDLTERAGDTPHRGLADVLTARAQLLALDGRADDADEALREAAILTSRFPKSVTHDSSLAGWGERRICYTEAFVHAHLGNAARADEATSRALELTPTAHLRFRTQLELLRSLAMVNSGDVTNGTQCARSAWESAPKEGQPLMVFAIAKDVLAAVPASERRAPAVTEYRELLTENAPATTA